MYENKLSKFISILYIVILSYLTCPLLTYYAVKFIEMSEGHTLTISFVKYNIIRLFIWQNVPLDSSLNQTYEQS